MKGIMKCFDAIAAFVRDNNKMIDVVALVVGFASIVLALLVDGDSSDMLTSWSITLSCVASVMGVAYLVAAVRLCYKMIEFDRLIVEGNYLLKVVTIVVLIPSTIATMLWLGGSIAEWYNPSVADAAEVAIATEGSRTLADIFRAVYAHYMDVSFPKSVEDGVDRVFVALFAILGVLLLNGLMVSTIIGWVDGRKERWSRGYIHYKVRHLGKHAFAVVIGANEVAALVVKRLLAQDDGTRNRYVVLHTSRDPEAVREELMSHLAEAEMRRIVIYQGLRDSMSEIEKLHLEWCNEVYVLGEATKNDGGDSSHDAMNMRTINLIANYMAHRGTALAAMALACGEKPKKLKCRVMLEYQTTYRILQFADIPERVKQTLDLIPFNRYESWARKVMVEGAAHNNLADVNSADESIRYTPLDGCEGIATESDDHVHLVIVGMTKMGVAMGVQALLQAHYLNYAHSERYGDVAKMSSRRTRITFIDANASQQMNFFKGRYENLFSLVRHRIVTKYILPDVDSGWNDPIMDDDKMNHLLGGYKHNFLDVEVDFVEGGLEDGSIRDYLRELCDSRGSEWVRSAKLTIAVCHEDTSEALASALYMPVEVYEKVQQVWVYQRESADIILNLIKAKDGDSRYHKLRPFGMLYGGYVDDDSYTQKAMAVNEAYKLKGATLTPERLEELERSWNSCSMAEKFSNYYFVDSIAQKLRAVGATLSRENIVAQFATYSEELARMEHNRWNMQVLILGYAACDRESVAEIQKALIRCRLQLESADAELQKGRIDAEEHQERVKGAKAAFKATKMLYRNSIRHMHNCICAFDNIDRVDIGAKEYDAMLNGAIPDILHLVDGLK